MDSIASTGWYASIFRKGNSAGRESDRDDFINK